MTDAQRGHFERPWQQGDPWPGCDYCHRPESWHVANYCKPQTADRQHKTVSVSR